DKADIAAYDGKRISAYRLVANGVFSGLTLERFIAGVSRREVTFGPRLAVAAKEGLDLFWTRRPQAWAEASSGRAAHFEILGTFGYRAGDSSDRFLDEQ